MPFLQGAGAGGGGGTSTAPAAGGLDQLTEQAGSIVGFNLIKPDNVSDAFWASTLQAIITNGTRDFGRGLLQTVFQGPSPSDQGAFGNLTGKQTLPSLNINLGGGGDSGPSAAERRRALRGQVAQSGFGVLPFDISQHIRDTVKAKGSFDSLVTRILADQRFQNSFPGILDDNGNLTMSPRDYMTRFNAYRDVAAREGVNLGKKVFGALVSGKVEPEEFETRIQALATFRQNKGVLRAFNQELASRGLERLKNPRDVLDFLSNRKPKVFYRVYEEASITAAARQAGLELTPQQANNIARRTQGVTDVGSAADAFSQAVETLRFAGPELLAAGLTEREVVNIALGIAPIRKGAKAERVLRNRQADIETQQVQRGVGLNRAGRPVVAGQTPEAGL